MTTTTIADVCPQCREPTVALGLPHRWCPACEWNLDQAAPAVLGWDRMDRRLHQAARRRTDEQFARLAETGFGRRSTAAARTVAAVLIAGVFGLAGLGVWLLVAGTGIVLTGFGVLLLMVAFLLRPRLGRLATLTDDAHLVDPAAAPQLFGLVARVAAEIGAPLPHVVLIGSDLDAYTTKVGLRRRRVLYLGLPLWATLDAQERVVMLGHQLGHFVNGDPRRGLLIQSVLGRAAATFRAMLLPRLLLHWLSMRDSQRAEYFADELGARAGGTVAAIRLTDHLLLRTAIDTVIRREARAGNGTPAWCEAAAAARQNHNLNLPLLRRLSRHTEVTPYASHPPTGLRAEMLARRPQHPAAVRLDQATSAFVDEELSRYAVPVRRALAHGESSPPPRPRRAAVVVVAAVAVLGFFAHQATKPQERVASIVVELEFNGPADLGSIGPLLKNTPGVEDVRFVTGARHMSGTPLQDRYLYEPFGGIPPDWYELTTRDQAAHDALKDGTFAEDILNMPGVMVVHFDCPDLISCYWE